MAAALSFLERRHAGRGYAFDVSSSRAPQHTRSGAGPSDAALVVAARGGEAWAQEALFRRHARRLNGLAYRVLGRDDEIDDLVQDTFIAALSALDRLDKPDAFASWIAGILVRQAYKKIRRRRMLARLGLSRAAGAIDLDELVSSSASPERSAELRAIYAVIESMPADVRMPIILSRVEGYGLVEIAELMEISLATVKRRIAEAEATLEQRFGKDVAR
ncbi:MAG: polymerase sigma factor RpoE [Labilithrix sp.]|jgi:RNA polymerase sigma-70 factor (ECF subfamily)|nr:polymerase sigma factor RpoE [Labilithrix sp.]